jgi:hypothetical protein
MEEKQTKKRAVKIRATERGLQLRSIDEMWRFCVACAASKDFKDIQTPEQAFVRVQAGMELGMSPIWSLTNIMVVNGRPSVWGDGALALVLRHPDCQDVVEKPTGDPNDDSLGWECTVYRRGREPKVGKFTIADAKRAQLWGKPGPWQQYRDRMLRMRARAFAMRDSFADVLRGLSVVEEMRDVEPRETAEAREPKPLILPDEVSAVPVLADDDSGKKRGESRTVPIDIEARESTESEQREAGTRQRSDTLDSRGGAKSKAARKTVSSNAPSGSSVLSGSTSAQPALLPDDDDDVPF